MWLNNSAFSNLDESDIGIWHLIFYLIFSKHFLCWKIMHAHVLFIQKDCLIFNSNFAHAFWQTKWIFILLETFYLCYIISCRIYRCFYFIILSRTNQLPFYTYYYILCVFLVSYVVSVCQTHEFCTKIHRTGAQKIKFLPRRMKGWENSK